MSIPITKFRNDHLDTSSESAWASPDKTSLQRYDPWWRIYHVFSHLHAADARKNSLLRHPGEPADHGFGRSQGGWSTKIHAAINADCGVMSFLITPVQAGNDPQMVPALDRIRVPIPGRGRPRCRPERVLADKAYSSRANGA